VYTETVSGEPQSIQVNFGRPMPIFPLDQVTLLPQQVLPLHIFEPRYRQMVEHALDGAGQIAMAVLVEDGWRDEVGAHPGRPAIRPAVCVGQIVQHEKLDDGRYNLLLQGVCRARVVEEIAPDDERMYRLAVLEPVGLDDENDPTAVTLESDEAGPEFEPSEHTRRPDPAELVEARRRIETMLSEGELRELRVAEPVLEYVRNEEIPASALLELVSFTVITDLGVRYALLAEPSAFRRARVIVGELSHLAGLIRRAKSQRPEEWPKGCSWN
jgi:Lon protease-like protein